jgi:hypothetical protein
MSPRRMMSSPAEHLVAGGTDARGRVRSHIAGDAAGAADRTVPALQIFRELASALDAGSYRP